jgi:glycosyltransferase involved in cell wall biosynthesis
MNIGFDAKRLFLNYTGLGNYSRFIVESLITHFPDNNYRLFTPRKRHTPDTDFFFNRNQVTVHTPPVSMPIKSLWRSAGVSFSKQASDLDVYHGLSGELPAFLPAKVKKVVTVHDLIFIRYPEYYGSINRAIYKAKLKYACDKADIIVAISQQTANDLFEFLKVPRGKVKVVYQGCHNQFRQKLTMDSREAIRLKHKIPENYILNVGTIEPRKNLLVLIRALALIPESERIPLVVVGKATSYFNLVLDEVKKLNLINSVIFIHNLPFNDLPAIYQGASVFVYPSFFEGFGIPIVEAIESGVPVITSTGSCFQEAGGPGAKYVTPVDPQEIANAILEIIHNQTERDSMVGQSVQYIQRFGPSSIAKEMNELYSQLVG